MHRRNTPPDLQILETVHLTTPLEHKALQAARIHHPLPLAEQRTQDTETQTVSTLPFSLAATGGITVSL